MFGFYSFALFYLDKNQHILKLQRRWESGNNPLSCTFKDSDLKPRQLLMGLFRPTLDCVSWNFQSVALAQSRSQTNSQTACHLGGRIGVLESLSQSLVCY